METRSSAEWSVRPGRFDVLNMSSLFPSHGHNGIPTLAPTQTIPTLLAEWHMPRRREAAARHNGALHFFLDDYRFETTFSSPARALQRALSVGCALSPDFSVWRDAPRAAQLWNVYRSCWVGAYWQAHGVDVIPTAQWAGEDSFDFCFEGLPQGSVVAVSSVGVRGRDAGLFRSGLEQLIARTQPTTILTYGPLRHTPNIPLPPIIEYPTMWQRQRKK